MTSAKKRWSYSAGERGRNRVRAYEDHKTGIILAEFYEGGNRKRISLGHRDVEKAKQQADEMAAELAKRRKLVRSRTSRSRSFLTSTGVK